MNGLRRALALFLSVSLLTIVPPQAAAAIEANPIVRVGLLYGNDAKPGVNLQNEIGSGYRFGYMEGGVFVEVGRTDATKISMVKNQNVYVTGQNGPLNSYTDSYETDVLIGAFHTEDGVKESREAAELRAAALRAEGRKAFVYYDRGHWGVRIDSFAASSSDGGGKTSGSGYCVTVVVAGTNDIIFQYDSHALAKPLVVAPDVTGVGVPSTHFNGRRYTGYFEYTRRDKNFITVINVVNMQDYVKGVVPYEVNPNWPIEALKAQAVTARSYAVRSMGKHASQGFDLCNTTHCQVYRGMGGAGPNSDRAVDETYGQYLTYNGEICQTYYSASNGGASEDSENVWNEKIDYLRGVQDIYEDLSRTSDGVWTHTLTNADLTTLLNRSGDSNSGIVDFYVSQRTKMGNVYEVTFVDSSGKKITRRKNATRMTSLGINSMRYSINGEITGLAAIDASGQTSAKQGESVWVVGADGEVTEKSLQGDIYMMTANGLAVVPKVQDPDVKPGVYIVSGRGNGHGVGMSQIGALCMADLGFTFDEILKFYYTGVEVTSGV
ncbi:MAG: SpoIID/LytB domain-containing protein [Oscillospiraceae bacterium]|jgi:stage II sporulation protein D|nr:SpoIID/LytB domain-containing protein [Oscillospiraceae bacterium]